jgi:glycosyltransferase involved in cell wall biosynthesis
MVNWFSMLAADRVFFNSRFHLEDWFQELPRLLKHFPDYVHLDYVPGVEAKSEVMPVGCNLARLNEQKLEREHTGRPLILWNQRWEYDKDPETFFRALDVLASEGVDFEVALAGSNVRQQAAEFELARERLGERVVHYGRASAVEYARLLWQADVVVSTALHEFFGIAVIEAIYCGCFPVLPRRLAYPEHIPAHYQALCLYDDGMEGLLKRLRWVLAHTEQARQVAGDLRTHVASFDWQQMAPRYDAALETIVKS